jgi:hypothetical protein
VNWLIQQVDSFRAIYPQIKGTGRLEGRDSSRHVVRGPTLVPAEDFWLGFHYFDLHLERFFPDCRLVASLEFARRSTDRRGVTMLPFETTLTAEHDRWREFRHPMRDQAAVIRASTYPL